MKTQMKKIAIAITMILAFFGEVNAQTDTCEIAILNDAKTTWISGSIGTVSYFNYRKSSISGIGGDTIFLRLQNSAGNVIHVDYWVLIDQNEFPMPNDTIQNVDSTFCVLPTDTTRPSGVRNIAYSNNGNELDQIIIQPKFFPSTVILSDGSKATSKELTLADFKLHVNLNYSALNSVTCDSIYWYKKNLDNNEFELISKTLKTDSYVATENGEYCVKAKVIYFIKSSPTDSCYNVRWESSDTVTVNDISQTYTVDFSVVGANGTLSATVDATSIISPATVEDGKDVIFTAVPATNFVVKEWKLNGIVVVGNITNNYTLSTLSADDTVTIEFKSTVGINEVTENVVSIYPNPTHNSITIEQPFSKNTMISIFNIMGELVLQKKMESTAQQIDISGIPNGSYIIQVKSNDKTEFGKIVKL